MIAQHDLRHDATEHVDIQIFQRSIIQHALTLRTGRAAADEESIGLTRKDL